MIGIIATDATDGEEVPEETRENMGILAPQIAIAIENGRLYSKQREGVLLSNLCLIVTQCDRKPVTKPVTKSE